MKSPLVLSCICIAAISRISGFQPVSNRRAVTTVLRLPNTLLRAIDDDQQRMSPTEIIIENERRAPDDQIPLNSGGIIEDIEDNSDRYPINLPSPLLLASSILLVIVSTGKMNSRYFAS